MFLTIKRMPLTLNILDKNSEMNYRLIDEFLQPRDPHRLPMHKVSLSNPSPLRCEVIVGTRPEAIKLAPVVKALRKSDDFLVRVVSSGQQGEICYSALAAFGLAADSSLDV